MKFGTSKGQVNRNGMTTGRLQGYTGLGFRDLLLVVSGNPPEEGCKDPKFKTNLRI